MASLAITSRGQALHISTSPRREPGHNLNWIVFWGAGLNFAGSCLFSTKHSAVPLKTVPRCNVSAVPSSSSQSHSSSAWSSFTTHNINIKMDSKEITPTKTIKDTIRNKRCLPSGAEEPPGVRRGLFTTNSTVRMFVYVYVFHSWTCWENGSN